MANHYSNGELRAEKAAESPLLLVLLQYDNCLP
jgi:hypothetical protein